MYAIVDIETTGNGIKGNKITEISIFRYDGKKITDEFTTLVNPECPIPFHISALTGIQDHMVLNAPTFSEIAPKVLELTRDAIFVAHSVSFDYGVIRHELALIGIGFNRKKLCTVRLSRKLFPGMNSYSLGKLCTALSVPLINRHRARGDAHATVLLFEKILSQRHSPAVIKNLLNIRSREATLPPLLNKEDVLALPEAPGIYFFRNARGNIIYIGKAKNIKKRVWSHFYDHSEKEVRMKREIASVNHRDSGSELVALLMESAAIKRHFPVFNAAQKYRSRQYGIFNYQDRNGIMHLAYNVIKKGARPLLTLYSIQECRDFLTQLCRDFQLCPKYCHLQEGVDQCSHFNIEQCRGVCRGQEEIAAYNARVLKGVKAFSVLDHNLILKEKGRHENEEAFVLILDGLYKGYGFIDKDARITSIADLEAFLEIQEDNEDIRRILKSYLARKKPSVFPVFTARLEDF